MSDITLSPLPYNGGNLQPGFLQTSFCYLGNGKYLHVFGQINPNYIFAFVSNQSNVTSGTFATSLGAPARAILANTAAPSSITSIRVFKLTSTSAAVMINGTLSVLTVDGTDNVTLKTATATPISLGNIAPSVQPGGNNFAAYGSAYSNAPIGSTWQIFYARDNVLYMMDRSATGALTANFKKIVYNPTADTLTVTTIATYTSTGNSSSQSFTRAYLQDIPGSSTKLLSLRAYLTSSGTVASAGLPSSVIVYAALIDSSDVVTPLAGTLASVVALAPLSTTNILGFANGRQYFTWNGSGWNSSAATFGANTPISIIQAEALDANYFVLFSMTVSGGTEMNSANSGVAVRIGRFVDSTFGQTSTATTANGGVPTGAITGYLNYDQQFIFRDSSSTFLIQAKTGTVQPVIRTIYQPGA